MNVNKKRSNENFFMALSIYKKVNNKMHGEENNLR